MFIYERETGRQNVSGGGAERGGDTESPAGSRLWAVSPEPDTGLKLINLKIMTWAKVGHLTDWATQAPLCILSYQEQTNNQNKNKNKTFVLFYREKRRISILYHSTF